MKVLVWVFVAVPWLISCAHPSLLYGVKRSHRAEIALMRSAKILPNDVVNATESPIGRVQARFAMNLRTKTDKTLFAPISATGNAVFTWKKGCACWLLDTVANTKKLKNPLRL